MSQVSMSDIARYAGVSVGTVDRVIHERGHVNPEKEKLIKSLCALYNYEANPIGKAMLMRKKEHRIAAIINSSEINEFCKEVHRGVSDAVAGLESYRFYVDFYEVHERTESEIMEALSKIDNEKYVGLIIKPIESDAIIARLSEIGKSGVKVVTCTSDLSFENKLCFVGQNHFIEGRILGNLLYLARKGEESNIIVLTENLSSVARREKLNGFFDFLDSSKMKYNILEICENSDLKSTGENLAGLIERNPRADALYLHPSNFEFCIPVLEKSEFKGIRMSYSHEGTRCNHIKSGIVDFEIYEEPYKQGYESVMCIFNYLLKGECPPDNKVIFNGYAVLAANA